MDPRKKELKMTTSQFVRGNDRLAQALRDPARAARVAAIRHDMRQADQVETIGQRVRSKIDQLLPHRSRREVAAAIGMSPDDFSRALSGQQNFSSIELAQLAEVLGEDVYWLITGEVDPHTILVQACHPSKTTQARPPAGDNNRQGV